jgi:hypothetical protein
VTALTQTHDGGSLALVCLGVNAVVFNALHVTYNGEYRRWQSSKCGVHWSILAMNAGYRTRILLQKTPAFKKFYFIGNGQETARSTASSRIAISALHL